MSKDILGLILSFIYLFGLLFAAEFIRKRRAYPQSFTRKCIHIGVGFWAFFTYLGFDSLWAVMIPPLSFVFVNILSYRYTIFKAMEMEDKKNPGTIFYPLSVCILLAMFWREPARLVPAIGLLVMGLGDGFATIIGQRVGRHRYRIWKHYKSLEGSLAMLAFSFLAVFLLVTLFTPEPFSIRMLRSLAIAGIATVAEGLSPWAADNITVPLVSGFAYALWFV
jgi:phytol kinase